jgi:hypothetical protein
MRWNWAYDREHLIGKKLCKNKNKNLRAILQFQNLLHVPMMSEHAWGHHLNDFSSTSGVYFLNY